MNGYFLCKYVIYNKNMYSDRKYIPIHFNINSIIFLASTDSAFDVVLHKRS